ncbi:MAG: quinoprotein dehydrogenase-associated SoxYZ-like carrier [Hyphomicrobium sp.]
MTDFAAPATRHSSADLPPRRARGYSAQRVRTGIAACAALLAAVFAIAPSANAADAPTWDQIRKEFFADRPINEAKPPVIIEAPGKAEDASLVPVTIYVSPSIGDEIKSLTVFIDNNPMPLVGRFAFGLAAGTGGATISTRVRFDTFSFLRAIVETKDGSLHMATHFVQAAGGCSSPAIKDAQLAAATAGQMHLKKIENPHKFASSRQSSAMREAQVMLRHPNYSGMQMDPVTGEFIPAKYVRELEVRRGGELVFHLDAGISLSSNPNIRFTYGSNDEEALEATAKDSDGAVFSASVPPSGT